MRLKGRELEKFVEAPPPDVLAVLVYGDDEGLVRDRAKKISLSVCEDLSDPFRVVSLLDDDYRDDPARIQDEFGAMAMTGGRRIIRLRPTSVRATNLTTDFIKALERGDAAGDNLVVIEAGELRTSSPLRKAVEAGKRIVALACYRESGRDRAGLVTRFFEGQGLSIERDALQILTERSGNDRGLTESELEKISLYVLGGPNSGKDRPSKDDGAKTVSATDVKAIMTDSSDLSIDDAIYAAASGDHGTLSASLDRCFFEGMTAVGLIRALSRHLEQLYTALLGQSGRMAGRPGFVPFQRKRDFENQLNIWSEPRLEKCLESLVAAELRCKTTGLPADAICRQAAHAVAGLARRR